MEQKDDRRDCTGLGQSLPATCIFSTGSRAPTRFSEERRVGVPDNHQLIPEATLEYIKTLGIPLLFSTHVSDRHSLLRAAVIGCQLLSFITLATERNLSTQKYLPCHFLNLKRRTRREKGGMWCYFVQYKRKIYFQYQRKNYCFLLVLLHLPLRAKIFFVPFPEPKNENKT